MKNAVTIFVLILSVISCSSPNKEGWQPEVVLISDTTKESSCVNLTTDEKGAPVISWCEVDTASGEKHFYMALMDEAGSGFSSRISVPIEQNTSLHEEGMPKVAMKRNGAIIAVYETSTPTDKNRFAGQVRFIVSTDKGKSWTKPLNLHADTVPGRSHSFAAITCMADGEIGAAWLDTKIGDNAHGRPVKFARTNAANGFQDEVVIDSVACECCRIAISSHAGGRVAIVYRDIIRDSIRDISIITSPDNGKSFSPAAPFSRDGWVINGCPHNGPSVALDNQLIYATWFTGGAQRGVFYSELDNKMEPVNRQMISADARFIQMCLMPDQSRILAFDESSKTTDGSETRIVLNRINGSGAFTYAIEASAPSASYPVIRPLSNDKVVVAWSQDKTVRYAVVATRQIDKPMPQKLPELSTPVDYSTHIKTENQRDPVCGMKISGSVSDTAQYNGKVYGFCSASCKNKFCGQPRQYAVN